MKALFTADLHGKIQLFEELKIYAKNSSIEIILLGGDILPSSLDQIKGYEDLILNQKTFIEKFLHNFLKGLLDIKTLKHVFLIPGNWDVAYHYIFEEPLKEITDLCLKGRKLNNGYELIGFPFVPPTPFRPKDYERRDDTSSTIPPQKNPSYIRSENKGEKLIAVNPYQYLREKETIDEDLSRLQKPHDSQKTIYIMHSPPFDTQLDRIEGGKKCGSISIRKFIEKSQPLLTLHGHIHESPKLTGSYIDRIGNTLSINPGQFSFKNLQAVIFELDDIEKTIHHTCF